MVSGLEGGLLEGELSGQCIWLDVLGTRAVRDGEVEAVEEQRPPGLVGV